ncbi:hypothetical protein N9Q06_01150 [bacterium]|nr:hypothetical protein [bacterium]
MPENNTFRIIVELVEAGIFCNSATTISLLYMLILNEAEQENIQLNKSKLIAYIPDGLGSLTRKRAALERLIWLGGLYTKAGSKRSEKLVFLSDRSKEILRKEPD